MAEKKNESQPSLFKMAAVGAPIAVGGGMAVSRLNKASSFFGEPVSALPNNPANDAIRKFTNRYVNPQRSGIYKDWQLEKLASLAGSTSLSADDTRNAIMRAASIADPTGAVENMIATRLGPATTGADVIKDLKNIMSGSSSIYAQRATSIFLEDIDVLDKRAKVGLSNELFQLETKIPRVFKRDTVHLKSSVEKDIFAMAEALKAKVSIREVSRKDIRGSELVFDFKDSAKFDGSFQLRIPRVDQENLGIVSRGATQQSRYISGRYGLVEKGVIKSTFNSEEWMVHRALEDLVPNLLRQKVLDQRTVRSLTNEFTSSIMESPELVPSLHDSKHLGVEEYIRQRSNVLRLYTSGEDGGLRPLNEREYYKAMEKGYLSTGDGGRVKVFPGASPGQISKGVASTKDFRSTMSVVPEAVPYGRRPAQFIRMASEPLYPEKIAAHVPSQQYSWAANKAGVPSPMIKAAYVSSSLGDKFAGTGVSAEGQFLITKELDELRAQKRIQQFMVSSENLADLAPMLDSVESDESAHWILNQQAEKGTFLGYSPEGRPVTLSEDMNLLEATAFKDKGRGDFVRVMATRNIEGYKYAKVFGGTKGMGASVRDSYLKSLLEQKTGVDSTGIEALITMDDLKKNRGLHYNQMFTSLWEFTNQNIQSGKTKSVIASNFANNPMVEIARMRELASNEDKFSHEIMLDEIKKMSRISALNPEQMGRVFGAVPDIFDDGMEALGLLSDAERAEISKGVATGHTQLFFEDIGAPGAGKTATIEPRTFELYGAPHFGSAGSAIQQEVAGRMTRAYPERLVEQAELGKAIESLKDLKQVPDSISPGKLLNTIESTGSFPDQAGHLNIPGMGDIYLPSGSQMSQMASYKTAGGYATESTLALAYKNTAIAANRLRKGEINQGAMNQQLAALENELSKTRVATVTGQGGLLRNRLPGSVALTGLQPTGADRLAANVAGITVPTAEKMFKEMRQLGGEYSDDYIEDMRRKFHRGEKLPGVVGRHPYIGPYSSQAMYLQKVAGDEDVIKIHEPVRKAFISQGRMTEEQMTQFGMEAKFAAQGNQAYLQKIQQTGNEVSEQLVRMSAFVGSAGDVDGDAYSAWLAGPQLKDTLAQQIDSPQAVEAYEDYILRSQLLKAKAKAGDVTLSKLMAGDALKLGITQGGQLGALSSSLQQYRAAALSGVGNFSAQERMDTLGLFEWLEQTPISSKHIAAGKELETLHSLGNLQEALQRKNATDIINTANAVMSQAKASGQSALREGFTISMENTAGEMTTRYVRGLELESAARNAVDMLNAFESAEVDGASASRMRQVAMGKVNNLTASDQAAFFNRQALDMSPFGSLFGGAGELTGLSKLQSVARGRISQVSKATSSILPHLKPLGIGAGVALGVATVLSEPPKAMKMGSNVAPLANMESGTGGAHLGYGEHPHESRMGEPTASNLVQSQHTARIGANDGSSGYRVSVRGSADQQLDMNSLNRQMQQALGRSSRINSSIRDQRASLTPQRLSSIIQDE